MNRGPRRGLGTFHCRCRWLLLLLVIQGLAMSSPTGPRVRQTSRKRLGAVGTGDSTASGSEFDPSHPPFHQVKASFGMLTPRSGHHFQQQHYPAAPAKSSLASAALSSRRGINKPIGNNEGPSVIRLMSKSSLFLQIFPNGSVSATPQDTNIFSVLERSAVEIGYVFLRGIASRQYLCLNRCGLLYGSKNLTEECILRENIENNWYNTYTSKRFSSNRKNLYVAISGSGTSCRLRLNSTLTRQGRPVTSLGVNEKFTQFFPVRNITLPTGMTLASLIEIGHNWSARDIAAPVSTSLGCAPQCRKPSGSSHPHKKRPKCRHKNCPGKSSGQTTLGQGVAKQKGKKENRRVAGKSKDKTKEDKSKSRTKTSDENSKLARNHKLRHMYRKVREHRDLLQSADPTLQ